MQTDRYDAVASTYVDGVGDDLSDPGTAGLLAALPDVAGLEVLDVACGHGRISRELARRGGRVTGVDLSEALLQEARRQQPSQAEDVTYELGNVASLDAEELRPVDVVTCNFGLSDIDDLTGTLHSIFRVLRPGGCFVLSILHPCFPGWSDRAAPSWNPTRGYLEEGWWRTDTASSWLRRSVGANHRTLATYLNTIKQAGLALDEVSEPPPPTTWTDEGMVPTPVFLVLRAVRPGS